MLDFDSISLKSTNLFWNSSIKLFKYDINFNRMSLGIFIVDNKGKWVNFPALACFENNSNFLWNNWTFLSLYISWANKLFPCNKTFSWFNFLKISIANIRSHFHVSFFTLKTKSHSNLFMSRRSKISWRNSLFSTLPRLNHVTFQR